jgi:hypothetical protein
MSGTITDLLVESSLGTPYDVPGVAIHVVGEEGESASAGDPQGAMVLIDSEVDTSTGGLNGSVGPAVIGRAFRGTIANPTRPLNGDSLLMLHGTSLLQDGVGLDARMRICRCGTLKFQAAEDWTSSSHATKMTVGLTPSGQLDENTVLTIGSDGHITVPGSINQLIYRASALRSANQSIANNSETAISFDTVEVDNAGMYSAGTPTRVTVQKAGVYMVTASVVYVANGTGDRYSSLQLNGGSHVSYSLSPAASASHNTAHNISYVAAFNVGDYLELKVAQYSGAALNATGRLQVTALSA